jgi:hypothetical protein
MAKEILIPVLYKSSNFQKLIRLISSLILLFSAAHSEAAERQKISLNGTWDFKWDNENRLSILPADSGWEKIKVEIISQYATGFGKDGKNHWAWYRRKVRVPETMKGGQIKIRFSQVKYKAIIFWNGERAGEHADGYIPFEIDISDKVKFEQDNILLVGVIDRIALQRPDVLPYSVLNENPYGNGSWSAPEASLLNGVYRTTRPIGGIVDNVDLVSYPLVHIEDFHITTSVRQSDCMVEVVISNQSGQPGDFSISAVIEDKGKIVKEYDIQTISLAGDEHKSILFKTKWDAAHYWSHDDPYLYNLVIDVYQKENKVDEIRFPFGFREYWIEGTDFYLNGKQFKIRRNHFNYGDSAEDAKRYMRALKSMNVNQIRLHHKAAPVWILAYADSIGMTLIPESSFYSRTRWYDIDNPLMWENAKKQWAGIVKSAKNHPSVVMYSVENEMQSTGAYLTESDPQKWERYVKHWAEVGQYIKNLDPTKPLQYSWGKDTGGWAETVNLHYQRDIKYFFQYPNDLYWLENENLTEKAGYGYGGRQNNNYIWKKEKPLILGEFGYQYHANPPHGLTPFIGDEAYVSNNWYKTWFWCLENKYRAYKYSGITANPWIFSSDREKLFKLEEVFLKDWRSNYYSGERLRKNVIVLNEDFAEKKLNLTITLADENKSYFEKSITLELQEGEKWERELNLPLPDTKVRINTNLQLVLKKNGKTVDSYDHPVHIFPRQANLIYDAKDIGLYDPQGKTFREVTASGFLLTRIDHIDRESLAKIRILLIGKDALTIGFDKKHEIEAFVKKGGRAVFLEQTQMDDISWPSFRLEIDRNHSSTIAFRAVHDHPLLNQIEDEDLKYWRGNHQVSSYNFLRPDAWNYTTLAFTGGGNGLDHTPFLALPCGQGLYLFSQFVLSDKMSIEPAALILFNNILRYALAYSSSINKAGILAADQSELPGILDSFGAQVEHFQKFLPADLDTYDVCFCDANIDLSTYAPLFKKFLSEGGTVVLRMLNPENLSNVKTILPGNVSLKPLSEAKMYDQTLVDPADLKISYSLTRDTRISSTPYPMDWENEAELKEVVCPIRAFKTGSNQLLDGISNTDLYWRKFVSYIGTFGEEIAPIAAYMVAGDKIVSLTEPTILAVIPVEKGRIIIDQIDWSTGLRKVPLNTRRIISNFLNNLGIKMTPYNLPRNE